MTNAVPLKILIVDDHAALRRTVRQMLEAAHVTCLETNSGEEAVALFAAEHPDWVIMDVRMPGLGGLGATQAIRKLDPQARVIAISQFTDPDCVGAAERAGVTQFVNKEHLGDLAHIINSPLARP
jgi:two-component system invasion response regulator UvrY